MDTTAISSLENTAPSARTTSQSPQAAQRKLGLALSGGGYRAAAFHLGTLRRLHQLGCLSQVDVLSTISGGSIAGANYCLHGGHEGVDMETFFQRMRAHLLRDNVIGQVLRSDVFLRLLLFAAAGLVPTAWLLFTRWAPTAPLLLAFFIWLLLRHQFAWFPISQAVEEAYNHFFFQDRTLSDLPAMPELAIGSSNLQSGRPFTFSGRWMTDSMYAYDLNVHFTTKGFPIARAVAASTCVPFAFSPVAVASRFFLRQPGSQPADTGPGTGRLIDMLGYPDGMRRVEPRLVDGGLYDNLGLQKLTQAGSHLACQFIIVSDAGGGWPFLDVFNNTVTLLLRSVNLFMHRIQDLQRAASLYQRATAIGHQVAYVALSWQVASCIPAFIKQMESQCVQPRVLHELGLPESWIQAPQRYYEQIKEHLEERVDYKRLSQLDLSNEQWRWACNIGTNLTPLTPTQLDLLVRQAENMTELQVRLYLPELFPPGN